VGLLEAIAFGRGGCLGSPRWRPIRKPFEDRRDRARSLPAAYANGFAQHVSDLIDADVGARYYAFAFWTTAGWGRYSVQVARRIQRACQFASCDVFPTLNRRSLNRIPFNLSLAAIVLPAQRRRLPRSRIPTSAAKGVGPRMHGFRDPLKRSDDSGIRAGRGRALRRAPPRVLRASTDIAACDPHRCLAHIQK